MSPDLLCSIEKVLNQKSEVRDIDKNTFLQLIKFFKKNDIINPGTILRKIDSAEVVYTLLEILVDNDVIEPNFRIYCHSDNMFNRVIYRHFSEIPDNIECEICGEVFSRDKAIVVVYRVIKDGE